jgi:hypothetical protein
MTRVTSGVAVGLSVSRPCRADCKARASACSVLVPALRVSRLGKRPPDLRSLPLTIYFCTPFLTYQHLDTKTRVGSLCGKT